MTNKSQTTNNNAHNPGPTGAAKFAVAGVLVGLVLAVMGLWQSGAFSDNSSAPELVSQLGPDGLYPNYGLQPYDQVVEIWSDKAAASEADYISRTNLGSALSGIGSERADLKKYEESELVLREALAINDEYVPAKLSLASALHSQHRFVEAQQIVQGVYEDDPAVLGSLALLGDTNLELGDYAQAAEQYDQLAALERSAPVVSRLARLASMRGDNDGAVALAEEALELSNVLALRPHQAAFYRFQLGHYRFETGDVDGAISDLEAALSIAPDHPGANEEYAFILASAGRIDDSLATYDELIATGPAADLHGLYADLLELTGATGAAAEQNRLGLELAKATVDRFPAERRHLVSFYLTRDPAVALELARADFAERQDVGAFDTLAWALYHNDRFVEAETVMTQGLEVGTRDAEMFYHAAAIAHAVGDDDQARRQLEAALEINPTFHPTEQRDALRLAKDIGL